MSSRHGQQPIVRTVGQRQSRDGQPMTDSDRALMTEMARYQTRAPVGVFFYSSHAEMEADRFRWTVEAVVERQRALAAGAVLSTSGGVEMPAEDLHDFDQSG